MRMTSVRRLAGVACAALVLPMAWAALAQTGPTAASAGIYSKAQAGRGAELFAAQCARCHGASMEGLDVAPPLTGERFLGNWTNQSVAELATRIRTTMPLDNPGALGLTASAEITTAILAANGYPAGAADMPTNVQQLQPLTIDAPPPGGK
jgi:mono/diheme cytochrome c family protein